MKKGFKIFCIIMGILLCVVVYTYGVVWYTSSLYKMNYIHVEHASESKTNYVIEENEKTLVISSCRPDGYLLEEQKFDLDKYGNVYKVTLKKQCSNTIEAMEEMKKGSEYLGKKAKRNKNIITAVKEYEVPTSKEVMVNLIYSMDKSHDDVKIVYHRKNI